MAVNLEDVAATRERVWAVLADGWTYSNWVVGTSHVQAVQATWPAPGSSLFHCSGVWPIAISDRTTVEECEPEHRLVMTAVGRPLGAARIELDLSDAPGGCRVRMTEQPIGWPARLLHNPLGEGLLRRRNTEALHRLAALAERRTAVRDAADS